MTATATAITDISKLGHDEFMALAATEYERTLDLLRALEPAAWETHVPDCPAWNVRQLMCHQLGAAESHASVREAMRQDRAAKRTAKARGMDYIDAWTANQVEARGHLSPDEIVAAAEEVFGRALRGRTKTPALIRRVPMKFPEPIGRRMPLGYLIDTIGNRDMWMHRVDISRAVGRDLVITPDHDGRLVADVVKEWADLHGEPFDLVLTGPAGGHYVGGEGGEAIEIDAVEFCRILSGRDEGTGLLDQPVPF